MKQIDDLVFSITAPIIVYQGYEDSIPDWMPGQIKIERLIRNMEVVHGEEELATNTEVLAYLNTASLAFPFSSEWHNIYISQFRESTYIKKASPDLSFLGDEIHLNDIERDMLLRLKRWIVKVQRNVWKERKKADKQRDKQEDEKKQKNLDLYGAVKDESDS